MDAEKSVLRTVDCLQRFYALLLALSTVEAFKKFVGLDSSGQVSFHLELLPDLLAFVFTIASFYHGMHRHLDLAYGTPVQDTQKASLQWYFLFDFVLSWIVFCLFFSLQMSMGSQRVFFIIFFLIFLINTIWAAITASRRNDQYAIKWIFINFFAFAFSIILAFTDICDYKVKHWIMAAGSFVRSVLDYYVCWEIFFPSKT